MAVSEAQRALEALQAERTTLDTAQRAVPEAQTQTHASPTPPLPPAPPVSDLASLVKAAVQEAL